MMSRIKKSLYDEYFNGQKHNIEELFSGALYHFLNDLSLELLLDSIDIEKYNELINKHFSSDDIEFTPSEVFNYFVYEDEDELKSEPVVNEIVRQLFRLRQVVLREIRIQLTFNVIAF